MSEKEKLLKEKVKDIKLKKGMRVAELVEAMGKMGGFSGQHMAEGVDALRSMLGDKESYNFLSFPADLVSTGLRGVLASMVKHFDAIITTCGTFDHDIARAEGGIYNVGTFEVDDNYMHDIGVYRLGNVFIDKSEYGPKVEEAFTKVMKEIYSKKGHPTEAAEAIPYPGYRA